MKNVRFFFIVSFFVFFHRNDEFGLQELQEHFWGIPGGSVDGAFDTSKA